MWSGVQAARSSGGGRPQAVGLRLRCGTAWDDCPGAGSGATRPRTPAPPFYLLLLVHFPAPRPPRRRVWRRAGRRTAGAVTTTTNSYLFLACTVRARCCEQHTMLHAWLCDGWVAVDGQPQLCVATPKRTPRPAPSRSFSAVPCTAGTEPGSALRHSAQSPLAHVRQSHPSHSQRALDSSGSAPEHLQAPAVAAARSHSPCQPTVFVSCVLRS